MNLIYEYTPVTTKQEKAGLREGLILLALSPLLYIALCLFMSF